MTHALATFETARQRAAVSGSAVLTAWRAQHGPETTRTPAIRAENDVHQNLTVDELAQRLGALATSYAGKAVTEDTARQVSAVYACVALIAGAVATLPLQVYERTPEGRKAIEHDYWWLLNEQPHTEISSATMWEYGVESRLYHGDTYLQILRPGLSSSRASGLMPHHPSRVRAFRDWNRGGKLLYRVQPEVGAMVVLDPADMIHVPGLGFDGLRSVSPITYAARQAIGTSMAAEEFSGRFFSGGARPDVALETDAKADPDQIAVLRATWQSRYGGTANANAGPVVLSGGLKMKQFSLSAEDSQLIATRAFQIEEICRIFGVPPHMVGHTDKATSWGAGVENMGRGFVKFTLQRHLVKIEQELNRKLWPTRSRYFVAFDVAGLERGDLKSENEALRIALGRAGEPGWMSQNDVRRIKNLPPVPQGDGLQSGAALEPGADSAGARTEPKKPDDGEPATA
ncbi:MAG: phage portal protein [Pseudomonadota bacterium]